MKMMNTHTNEQIAGKPAQSEHKTVRFKPLILAWVTGSIPGVDATTSKLEVVNEAENTIFVNWRF